LLLWRECTDVVMYRDAVLASWTFCGGQTISIQ